MAEFINYPLPGEKYQHYKGGIYEIICLANHTDDDEPLVIYKSLSFGGIHARPFKEWFDDVETEISGVNYKTKRFQKI